MKNKAPVKTIGLVSGGLDSTLATRIMGKLGFDITVLNFSSPFCTCTHQGHGCKNEAARLAEELENGAAAKEIPPRTAKI